MTTVTSDKTQKAHGIADGVVDVERGTDVAVVGEAVTVIVGAAVIVEFTVVLVVCAITLVFTNDASITPARG